MTPAFVKAVDPIIKMMVDLKEQIERNAAPSPEAIRDAFIRRFNDSERLLHTRADEWDLAKYALVVWIDEQLASSLSWPGSSYWNQNKLQIHYYRTQVGREHFFRRAKDEAEQLPKKDALEVYFLCVVLGFQGVYNGAPGLQRPQDIGVPESIEAWLRRTREWIKLSPAKVSEKRSAKVEHYAAPLNGKYQLLGMVMTFIVTFIVAGLVVYVSIQGNQPVQASSTTKI